MINCTDNSISTEKYLEAMLRVAGALTAFPIVAVTGHTQPAINCNNAHLQFEDFLRLSIGADSCSKPALRVKFVSNCTSYKTCKTNVDSNPLRKIFAYDATTKTYALVINQST